MAQSKADVLREHGLVNAEKIIAAATAAKLPLEAACALMEKESGGHNVYGHDAGGAMAGFPHPVTKGNYEVFRWLVFDQGHISNGVGPAQITSKGLLTEMETEGLRPWNPEDNMQFGMALLAGFHATTKSWVKAGTRYNGSVAYGEDLAERVKAWRKRLAA